MWGSCPRPNHYKLSGGRIQTVTLDACPLTHVQTSPGTDGLPAYFKVERTLRSGQLVRKAARFLPLPPKCGRPRTMNCSCLQWGDTARWQKQMSERDISAQMLSVLEFLEHLLKTFPERQTPGKRVSTAAIQMLGT